MSAQVPCSKFVPDKWRKGRCNQCFCNEEAHSKDAITNPYDVERLPTATLQFPPRAAPKPFLHNKIKPIDNSSSSIIIDGMFQKFYRESEIVLTMHLLNLLMLFMAFSRKDNE